MGGNSHHPFYKSVAWKRLRAKVLSRDNQTCQDCGYTVEVPAPRGVKKLAVHHVVDRNEGGTDDPTNLITLCQACHIEAHRASKRGNEANR